MSARNEAKIEAGGPLCVTGSVRIEMSGGEVRDTTEAFLCRCGRSADKPFCDGSHSRAGFDDAGLIQGGRMAARSAGGPAQGGGTEAGDGGESRAGESAAGPVTIVCAANGPLLVRGPLTVVASDGGASSGEKGALCRCGESSTKPFCDGAHRRIGFEAE